MLSNDTPKVDNIAMAISGGKTLDIVKACDIFYGNQEPSTTIVEAIQKGIKAGSPFDSIDAILREALRREEEAKYMPEPVIFEKPEDNNVRKLKRTSEQD